MIEIITTDNARRFTLKSRHILPGNEIIRDILCFKCSIRHSHSWRIRGAPLIIIDGKNNGCMIIYRDTFAPSLARYQHWMYTLESVSKTKSLQSVRTIPNSLRTKGLETNARVHKYPGMNCRLAEKLGPVCPQKLPDISDEKEALDRMPRGRLEYLKRILPHLRNQSEDCLYLNIYAPAMGESTFSLQLYRIT